MNRYPQHSRSTALGVGTAEPPASAPSAKPSSEKFNKFLGQFAGTVGFCVEHVGQMRRAQCGNPGSQIAADMTSKVVNGELQLDVSYGFLGVDGQLLNPSSTTLKLGSKSNPKTTGPVDAFMQTLRTAFGY